VLVVSLGYMFQHQGSAADDYLFGGEPIPSASIQAMEQAFGKANLSTYTVEGARIRVPQSQRSVYMAALADAKALPPSFGKALTDAIGNMSLSESPKQSYMRLILAKQEELQLIISRMSGIESASVLIDMENSEIFNQPKIKTASVSVKPVGSAPLDPEQAAKIRAVVAAAVAGMKPADVTVADMNSGTVVSGPEQGGVGGESLFAAATQQYERMLKKKVLEALAFIPNVTVTANVTLDKEKSINSIEVENGPKTVTLSSTEKTTSKTREGGNAPSGRPGLGSQQPNTGAAVGGAGKSGSEQNDETESHTVNDVATKKQTVKETLGLTPRSARVSVGIPMSYFAKVWLERNPPKPGEEAKKPDQAALATLVEEITPNVRKAVAPLLPSPPEGTTDATEAVTVTTFQDIKMAEIPTPVATQKAITWLGDNWRTLGLAGLVLASLLVVRSMVRGIPEPASAAISARVSTPETETAAGETPEATAAKRLRRISAGGPSLRDELSDLVKEDPDSAANILRTWIGSAG
jgi:flagellar M-ring protein FliF